MDVLEKEIIKLQRDSSFDQSIEDVDKIIQQLEKARDAIESEPQFASITLTKLQHPLKNGFEKVNDDIKKIHKAHGAYGKAVNSNLPKQTLLNEIDALANHTELVNRAITMHLLREGQFGVASTFYEELQNMKKNGSGPGADPNSLAPENETVDEGLQGEFETMYNILHQLKERNLHPAIEWAQKNSRELETRGSNLEFELSKLQFVWLFLGPEANGLPDDENNGLPGALQYARDYFPRFQSRFLKEIQQLITAMVFESNLQRSPYRQTFDTSSSWSDVCTSFTREFCSLLGLSAESPLYLAATAGAIALPTLIKLATIQKTKRTNWTTDTELAVEIPLPRSMIFHPIFVCPVSKEQTNESNPPMMLPCGHVVAKESLQKLSKGGRFKCPYCPVESQMKEAKQIYL
ncbi:putative regulator of gluconeogenesis protein [Botrytis fragariae]|uniref:GID complex catalytic subunit 2 n=1 Tax=Botrytis fragariae TaxID=1964551 RepID=A0A8H6ARF2_9HELO|nr:putative regulator of gluconeogenesis protein [Botrytis fragariae]KAF5872015.1 putative regulator of gluconeogenesis protein [Botrytis fragariae]